jgi:hypothetical protein
MPALAIIHIVTRPKTLKDDQFIGILGNRQGRDRFAAGDIVQGDDHPVVAYRKIVLDLVINRIVLGAGIQKFFDVAYGGGADSGIEGNQGTKTNNQPTCDFFSQGNLLFSGKCFGIHFFPCDKPFLWEAGLTNRVDFPSKVMENQYKS